MASAENTTRVDGRRMLSVCVRRPSLQVGEYALGNMDSEPAVFCFKAEVNLKHANKLADSQISSPYELNP